MSVGFARVSLAVVGTTSKHNRRSGSPGRAGNLFPFGRAAEATRCGVAAPPLRSGSGSRRCSRDATAGGAFGGHRRAQRMPTPPGVLTDLGNDGDYGSLSADGRAPARLRRCWGRAGRARGACREADGGCCGRRSCLGLGPERSQAASFALPSLSAYPHLGDWAECSDQVLRGIGEQALGLLVDVCVPLRVRVVAGGNRGRRVAGGRRRRRDERRVARRLKGLGRRVMRTRR